MANRLYRTTGTRLVSEWVINPPPIYVPPPRAGGPKPSAPRPKPAPDPTPAGDAGPGSPSSQPWFLGGGSGFSYESAGFGPLRPPF